MHYAPHQESVAGSKEQPIGELTKSLSEQVPRLVRDEIRLAVLELKDKGKRAGLGSGLLGGAALVALYGAGALLAAVIMALALAIPGWASALIIGAALVALAGGMALMGRAQIQKAVPPTPTEAIDSVHADIDTVKENARHE